MQCSHRGCVVSKEKKPRRVQSDDASWSATGSAEPREECGAGQGRVEATGNGLTLDLAFVGDVASLVDLELWALPGTVEISFDYHVGG